MKEKKAAKYTARKKDDRVEHGSGEEPSNPLLVKHYCFTKEKDLRTALKKERTKLLFVIPYNCESLIPNDVLNLATQTWPFITLINDRIENSKRRIKDGRNKPGTNMYYHDSDGLTHCAILFSQYYKKRPLSGLDTTKQRLSWFAQCLNHLKDYIDKNEIKGVIVSSKHYPNKHLDDYRKATQDFSNRLKQCKVLWLAPSESQ